MDKLVKYEINELRKSSSKYVEYSNYVKLAAQLVDYGFQSSWLSVDDNGADFIAVHILTCEVIRVQIKSRISIDKKYESKNLFIAFPKIEKEFDKNWVIVPHDVLKDVFTTDINYLKNGGKSSRSVPKKIWEEVKKLSIIEPFDL
jgi:hypothetical protein